MTREEKFMKAALKQAERAASELEVPVGAVIVHEDKIIARGRNRRETGQDALAHAELEAIRKACKKLGSWRLLNCEMYVTLEPCPMCAGAIVNSRVEKLFYGAPDPRAGACESVVNLFELPLNHKPAAESGILRDECARVLSVFFMNLRKAKLKKDDDS